MLTQEYTKIKHAQNEGKGFECQGDLKWFICAEVYSNRSTIGESKVDVVLIDFITWLGLEFEGGL